MKKLEKNLNEMAFSNYKYNLMINNALFDYKSDFNNVKNPFFYIYKKYHDLLTGIESLSELNKRLFSNKDNKCLFYTGLENKAQEKCKKAEEKVNKVFQEIANNFRKEFTDSRITKYVKINLKNQDNSKAKRLLCILNSFNIEISGAKIIHFDILFPITYDDLH